MFTGDVALGAIWAALPSVHMLPTDQHDPKWPIALDVLEDSRLPEEGVTKAELISFSGAPGDEDEETIRQTLGKYPSLPKGTRFGINWLPLKKNGGRNWIAKVLWPEAEGDLDSVAPKVAMSDNRALIPALARSNEPLRPLMLWWVLLFGLSIFARYRPDLWAAALEVDKSKLAVPLEHVLEQAMDLLPALVYEPLMDEVA